MKTNAVPAVVMLLAGLIDCIASIVQRLSLFDFTRRLLIVLVVFYLLGCAVKLVLDVCVMRMADPPEEETGEDEISDHPEETAEGNVTASVDELENIDAQEGNE